jgi:hypothetical protein
VESELADSFTALQKCGADAIMPSQQRKTRIQWTRRLISLIVLIGILGSFVPLPAGLGLGVTKDLSKPFPCQYRACGCRSADQCWKQCCCFTNSQKVAWAKAEEIALPDFVLTAAEREEQIATQQAKQCCQSRVRCHAAEPAKSVGSLSSNVALVLEPSDIDGLATLRETIDIEQLVTVIDGFAMPQSTRRRAMTTNLSKNASTPHEPLGRTRTERRHPQHDGNTNFVMGVLVLQCEGQGWFWNSLPWSIISDTPKLSWAAPTVVAPVMIHSDRDNALSLRPPVPPPRRQRARSAIA